MSNKTIDKIQKAVRDGLANHTGEWLNFFLIKDTYTVEQLTQLLNDICESKRLNNNIQALITEEVEQAVMQRDREWMKTVEMVNNSQLKENK